MLNVILLGLVSFFADISSEMVYPLIPLYLSSRFGATPLLVGFIEGIAESLASLLKVFSGYLTDRTQKKKPIAFLGYSTGLIYKLALIFANSWIAILGARVIDRVGKGIRTTPRDVMVAESAQKDRTGTAFGVHKAMDMAGSALGILIAYFLVKNSLGNTNYPFIFLISMIPAGLSLVMFFFIKEQKHHQIKKREPFWKHFITLPKSLKWYLLVVFLFTLGNSSNTFLLLKAKNIGFSEANVIFLYFLYNISASLLAIPAGRRSDQIGRKPVLIAAYVVFALVYFGFAVVNRTEVMVGLFILYGVYTALITGVERAYISEIAPQEVRGTLLGLHGTIIGLTLFPASMIAGVLWTMIDASAPFIFGGSLALAAALTLGFVMKDNRKEGSV
jgi:MFS family permease